MDLIFAFAGWGGILTGFGLLLVLYAIVHWEKQSTFARLGLSLRGFFGFAIMIPGILLAWQEGLTGTLFFILSYCATYAAGIVGGAVAAALFLGLIGVDRLRHGPLLRGHKSW